MYLSFYVFFVGFFICLENTALALAIAALKSSHHSHNRIDSIFYLWKVVSDRNPNFKAESLKGISWRKKKGWGGELRITESVSKPEVSLSTPVPRL